MADCNHEQLSAAEFWDDLRLRLEKAVYVFTPEDGQPWPKGWKRARERFEAAATEAGHVHEELSKPLAR